MSDKPARFAVVCADWKVDRAQKHKSREAAERRLEGIKADGVCRLEHEIVEV